MYSFIIHYEVFYILQYRPLLRNTIVTCIFFLPFAPDIFHGRNNRCKRGGGLLRSFLVKITLLFNCVNKLLIFLSNKFLALDIFHGRKNVCGGEGYVPLQNNPQNPIWKRKRCIMTSLCIMSDSKEGN